MIKANKLNPGREYIFRIKAENRFGISEPLVSLPVKAEFHFKTPQAPPALVITHCAGEQMTINWQPPIKNGGSNITGYFVEKKDRN